MNESTQNEKRSIAFVEYFYKYGVYVIFLLMVIVFAFSNKNFLTAKNAILIVEQSAPLMLGVCGMAFVLMLGGIDISAGANMYLSAVVASLAMQAYASANSSFGIMPYAIGITAALFVGALVGLINGYFIVKLKMVPFIMTLAMTNILTGIGYVLTKAKLLAVRSSGFQPSSIKIGPVSIIILIALIVAIILHFLMKYSVFGRHLMAQGNNEEAARKIGIRTEQNAIIAYVICGAMSGFGGILSAGQVGAISSNFANGNEFDIIPAAVLGGISLFGGKGSILPGAVIGIILVNTITNGLTMMSANPYVYTIVRGLIIFVAVMLDSVNYEGELR